MNPLIYLDMFLVVAIFALTIAFIIYQIQKIKWLKRHGKQIVATITSIRRGTGKTPTGFSRDHYFVIAQWTNPLTGRTYTFWTWIMNSYPGYSKGSLVPVVVDPNNPKHYNMDC